MEPTYWTFYLPTVEKVPLIATVEPAAGGTGSYEWVNLSGGALAVDETGRVSADPAAPGGSYEIAARAKDDPAASASAWFTVVPAKAHLKFTID